MTDLHLTDLVIRAQEDARRCYQIYITHRNYMWANPGDTGAVSDCAVWQYRASVAADHALKMRDIMQGYFGR